MLDHHENANGSGRDAVARLHAVLLCDLADSTALIERLGDAAAAELIRSHDRIARDCVHRHGGREIDKTDGFLMLFERPVQAVAFALDYQHALRGLAQQTGQPLRSRVGIHVGEVLLWNNAAADIADGAKPVEVEGLAKAIAARMMSLARPGQILLSETAFGLAQRARHELGSSGERLRWLNHGRYRLKGMDVPLPVFEVGEAGAAPLEPPPSAAKAKRLLPWWRTRWAHAAALLAVLAVPLVFMLRPEPAIAFAARDWVLVGDVSNLTGESLLDDSLEAALRIALEQSRHVNVMSKLSVSDAMKRMRMLAETTVNRTVGAEIALREGARALLLPTVAEVGGRVRFTLEVVDPQSQVTVFAESAEGAGLDSSLQSVDEVVSRIRARLDESMAEISKTSAPLPKVSTASLEALRAFALGREEYNQSRPLDALRLYDQALTIDPEFALARASKAAVHLSRGESEQAHHELGKVDVSRLTTRDRLYVDALNAWLSSPPAETLSKWQLLAKMYPDSFPAHANEAIVLSSLLGRHDDGLRAAQHGDSNKNPMLRASLMTIAEISLALGRVADAERRLQQALQLGSDQSYLVFALTQAVKRDRQQFEAIIGAVPDAGLRLRWIEVAVLVEEGRWPEATVRARAIAETAHADNASAFYGLVSLALASATGDGAPEEIRIEPVIASSREDLDAPVLSTRNQARQQILGAALLAARLGEVETARRGLAAIGDTHELQHYPYTAGLHAAVLAEIARGDGRPDEGLAALVSSSAASGDTFQMASARLRLLVSSGRHAEVIEAADWLMEHRGLAYIDPLLGRTFVPLNVLDAYMAALSAGEAAAALGQSARARGYLDAFVASGQALTLNGETTARVERLRRLLAAPGDSR